MDIFFCLTMGGLFSIMGGWSIVMTRKVAAWPAVQGEIIRSHIFPKHGDELPIGIEIAYLYCVKGRTYENNRISYAPQKFGLGHYDKLIAQHPVGAKVKVYYDPCCPKRSVISNELDSSGKTFFFVGIILLATALARYITK